MFEYKMQVETLDGSIKSTYKIVTNADSEASACARHCFEEEHGKYAPEKLSISRIYRKTIPPPKG